MSQAEKIPLLPTNPVVPTQLGNGHPQVNQTDFNQHQQPPPPHTVTDFSSQYLVTSTPSSSTTRSHTGGIFSGPVLAVVTIIIALVLIFSLTHINIPS